MKRLLQGAVPAFGLYLLGALLVGEVYPFSRYTMYAISGYDRGTALVFLADGQPVGDLRRFRAFADFDTDRLQYPPGQPGSQEYLLDAVRHQVRARTADRPPEEPSVHLQIGFQVAEPSPQGPRVVEPFVLLAEGRAWSTR